MPRILIIAQGKEIAKKFALGLTQRGYNALFSNEERLVSHLKESLPDMVLLEISDAGAISKASELLQEIKQAKPVPVMGLLLGEVLNHISTELPLDDFIVLPCDEVEIIFRIKRLLHENGGKGKIVAGDLVMNPAKYEVTLAGRHIELTYREYELLRFLMSNKGRAFTRQALMDRVWGFDFYGGDRTVDVHIRRLRSKIEDATHVFIETVRSIGYRFRDDV